jgi:phosphoribosylaminoimidazole-succinocarboxamide synthase
MGIPTHFIRRLNMREQLIREVEIIPLEVVVRNVAAGSLSTRLGIEEGTRCRARSSSSTTRTTSSTTRWSPKSTSRRSAGPIPQEIDDIMALAIRVNDFLAGLFLGVGIRLVDFKMECGRLWEGDMMRIVVADEISPDSCRLWDIVTNDKLDKDRFRRDLGGMLEAYQEVARRLGILNDNDCFPFLLRSEMPVRQGKVFDVEIDGADKAKAEADLNAMCEKLLANTVIENYAVEIA